MSFNGAKPSSFIHPAFHFYCILTCVLLIAFSSGCEVESTGTGCGGIGIGTNWEGDEQQRQGFEGQGPRGLWSVYCMRGGSQWNNGMNPSHVLYSCSCNCGQCFKRENRA